MNPSFIILGTDTDAGKSTLAVLWLSAFADEYAYWKPLETGPSDTANLRELVPRASVHAPIFAFAAPVAPPLAARLEGRGIPAAKELTRHVPRVERPLVVETFGSPFSPLNEGELQLEWIKMLGLPAALAASSALGAIGRTLQTLAGLETQGVRPRAIVLVGPEDRYAEAEIRKHSRGVPVFSLQSPNAFALDYDGTWTPELVAAAAAAQRHVLDAIRQSLMPEAAPSRRHGSDWLTRDRRGVWHPYTSLASSVDPLVCVGADREFLHLADGQRVIDAISSWWTILFRHRDPVLLEAWRRATEEIDHVLFAGVTHPWGIELAERLLARSYPQGRVFYSDNGSTAVEVALKMAYQFWRHHGEPGRTRFVGFEHGYHGDTFGAMAVSRDPVFFAPFEPLLFGADIVPLDPERLDAHLADHAFETAGVIVEPLVQGAGGMRMHAPETLAALAECCRRHNVLLIADEVMTGCGRTGTFWAHERAGIRPDVICSAKTLAGGLLPLAATIAAPHIAEAFASTDPARTLFHGHSFTAHPLACAVALANLRRVDEGLSSGPARIEAFWRTQWDRFSKQEGVEDVRGRGSIFALTLRGETGYLAHAGRPVAQRCLEQGVFLRPLGNVVYVLPPYEISDESLGRIADALIESIRHAQGESLSV
jgi:adenosylmethionine-8-amino-7-oxononanoate transaminase/dethiobiotin synthase